MFKKGAMRFLTVFLLLASFHAVRAEESPNILLIITDEHNFRTLGCYRDHLPKEQAEMWGPGVIFAVYFVLGVIFAVHYVRGVIFVLVV